MQRQGPIQISYEQEDKTNGVYGSRSLGEYMLDGEETIRDGVSLDTMDRRGDRHRYYSSSGSNMHYDRHCYHPYRRSGRGYLSDEFKKENPPIFDGEMNKSQEAQAWLLGMKKLF